MERIVLDVEGMSCEHCVKAIKSALGDTDGIANVDVDLENKTVTVEYDSHAIKIEDIRNIIEEEGYEVK